MNHAATDPIWQLLATEAKVRPPHVFHCFHAVKEQKARFNVAAFAHYCQLNTSHIEAILAVFQAHGILNTGNSRNSSPPPAAPKGERLPPDFQMPSDWLLWAQTQRGWTIDVARTEADTFKDFWLGNGAVKQDWQATWRNWVRKSKRPDGVRPSGTKATTIAGGTLFDRVQSGEITFEEMHAERERLRRNANGQTGHIADFISGNKQLKFNDESAETDSNFSLIREVRRG